MVSKSQKINPLLRVGDHLIARRFAYTHHGLYMGDGKVLEYIQNGGVTIVPLETFASVMRSTFASTAKLSLRVKRQ